MVIMFLMIMMVPSYASAWNSLDGYQETTDSFCNPERGFYSPVFLKLKEAGTVIPEEDLKHNLIHLRVDLSDFGGTGKEISAGALDALGETLETVKQNGGTAIIRFAYDAYFSGRSVLEPELAMMKKHIRQVGAILEKHEPVIVCVEAGMLGVYGEYHGTAKCTAKNRKGIIQAWLDSLSAKFTVSVRTPGYVAEWAGISLDKLCRQGTSKEGIGRIGIYNDGYLGSYNDLGTYANRENELDWLDEQTDHTFFGGEIVAYIEKDTPKNTAAYMESEGFLTHTSYLNEFWNDAVVTNLKNEIFDGKDSLYKGQSGYRYVENHLGYRFVLTDSKILADGCDLEIFMQINNVGFGSMVNDKAATILLESESRVYELSLADFDIRACKSQYQIRYTGFLDISQVESGDYQVYFRISEYGDHTSDHNYNCVRFANDSNRWNELFGANLIGDVQITKNETDMQGSGEPHVNSFEAYDLNRRFHEVNRIRYKLDQSNAVIKRLENKKSIIIPENIVVDEKTYAVTGLGHDVLQDCSKLQSIKIFNKTKEITEDMFRNCKKLKSITFSKSIKKIAQGSFNGTSLKKIIYSGKKSQFDKLKLNWLHHVKVYTSNKTFTLK